MSYEYKADERARHLDMLRGAVKALEAAMLCARYAPDQLFLDHVNEVLAEARLLLAKGGDRYARLPLDHPLNISPS